MATSEMVKHAWRGQPAPGTEQPQAWDFGTWTNPLLTAPLVYLAGIILNIASVDWWWPALGGLGFVVSFYAAARSRGLRKLGVGFTVASGLVGTGWLVYSTLVLTFNVLDWGSTFTHAIAGGVITIPLLVVYAMLVHDTGKARVSGYLAHHEPPAPTVRPEAAVSQVWAQITRSAGIKKWTVATEPEVTKDAITVVMRVQPGGTTYREAIQRIDALELACNAPFPGAVRLEQPRGAGVATVIIRQALRSTLSEIVPAPPPPAQPLSILEPIVDARFDDGAMSERSHAYQSVITLGQRDSGKTGLQNVRVDAYTQRNDVFLIYIDFKEGRFLRPWLEPFALGKVNKPVFGGIGTSVATASMILDGLLAIGESRGKSTTGDKIKPTSTLPAIRFMVDEVADLLSDQAHHAVATKLVKVVRKLRSEGVDIDIASQRGTMSFLGAAARDLLSQATIVDLLRVDSAAEVYNALSIPADKLGSVDPTRFEYPGTKLTLARGARLAAARSILIHDTAIPDRAAHYAPWRPSLEAAAVTAADRATRGQFSRMLAYDTDEARAVLAASAAAAGNQDAADRWVKGYQPTIDTNTDVTVGTPEPTTVSAPAIESANAVRDRFIEEHGADAWERVQGRMALIAMRTIIGGRDYILTADLLDQLAAADSNRWADLDAQTLAGLLDRFDVRPVRIRAENNVRGYRRVDIEASFDTERPDGAAPGAAPGAA